MISEAPEILTPTEARAAKPVKGMRHVLGISLGAAVTLGAALALYIALS